MKRKIYRFLEQLKKAGGTETATISFANELIKYYDITFIVSGKESKTTPYDIDQAIKIIYLNNDNNIRVDEKILRFCKEKRFIKLIKLLINVGFFLIFTKYIYRHKVKKLTNKDDILIASSLDNYLIMPRSRNFIKHYHFNFKYYSSLMEKVTRLIYVKPDYNIFLDEVIYKDAIGKYKRLKRNSTFINNPIKLDSVKNINYYNNNFIFIGRFAEQKNPFMLIKAMKQLKDNGVHFNLSLYGEGKFKERLISLINELNLNDNIRIFLPTTNIKEALKDKDVLLLTSIYEGRPLVINEAYSQSVPVFSTNFGDSVVSSIPKGCGEYINSFDPKEYAKGLIEFVKDKDKLMEYRLNAYLYSLNFNKEEIAKKWVEVIENNFKVDKYE